MWILWWRWWSKNTCHNKTFVFQGSGDFIFKLSWIRFSSHGRNETGATEKSVANWRIMLPWCYTASSTKRGRDSCEVWRCFQLSLLPRCVDRDNSAHNHWLLIAYSQKVGILSEVASDEKVCIRMTNHTAQKIKFWPNPQRTADLVTLTEEILNGKLHFLRGVLT